ncbi:glycosyltransferase family 25 protein [Falsiroseomonas tokyonensis]|uniref:Glycosyltransferase family 25 protein n=1 Tax=Falsiroseomonas tokyonensis TaxID=430521 RepID=A0ABV7BWH4_9PROT|nr:glycosyltransferase family 25 protein [Falsiroseomonas tokyonensis]MBU8539862.1 glycosyltransferase family 25 protein [Falsiroseomonas tokyonensis]
MQKIIVINLDSDRARFERISDSLAEQGMTPHRLPALRGTSLPKLIRGFIPGAANAEHGTLGCFLSHVRSWETIVENGWDGAIILEDDARIARPLEDVGKVLSEAGADLVFLNDRMSVLRRADANSDEMNQVISIEDSILERGPSQSTGCGGDGYWLSRAGAESLLAIVAQHGVQGDVDWLILFAAVGKEGLARLKRNYFFFRKLTGISNYYDLAVPVLKGAVLKVAAILHPGGSSSRKEENALNKVVGE